MFPLVFSIKLVSLLLNYLVSIFKIYGRKYDNKFQKTILISEDDAGRVGWGGFGGFSAVSLCVAGTRGCEWAEAQGWSESWWQTAWIYPWKPRVESLRSHRCFHYGKYWRNREADGQIVYVLMVTQTERGVFFSLLEGELLLHRADRGGATKPKEWQKWRKQRATRIDEALRVSTKKQCPRSAKHPVVQAPFNAVSSSPSIGKITTITHPLDVCVCA